MLECSSCMPTDSAQGQLSPYQPYFFTTGTLASRCLLLLFLFLGGSAHQPTEHVSSKRTLLQAVLSWDPANVLGLASFLSCQTSTRQTVVPNSQVTGASQLQATVLHQSCNLTHDVAVNVTSFLTQPQLVSVWLENIELLIDGNTNKTTQKRLFKTWDLGNMSSLVLLRPGASLTLANFDLDNALLGGWAAEAQGRATAAAPFSLLAVALDPGSAGQGSSTQGMLNTGSSSSWMADSSQQPRLVLSSMSIYTSCDAVRRFQAAVCRAMAADSTLGGWASVYQASVVLQGYHDKVVQAANVELTCRQWANQLGSNWQLSGESNTDCLSMVVPLEGSIYLLDKALQNLGISAGYAYLNQPLRGRSGAANAQDSPKLRSNFTLRAMGRWDGSDHAWQIWDAEGAPDLFPLPAPATITVSDVAFVNLPGGSARYAPFHLLTALQWQFTISRSKADPVVTLANCTLLLPPDEMAFWDMALSSLTSGSGPWAPPGPAYDSLAALVSPTSLAARPLQWGDPLLGARGADLAVAQPPASNSSSPRPWLLQRMVLVGAGIEYNDVVLRPGWGLQVSAAVARSWLPSTPILSALTLPDGSLGSLANVGLLPARVTPGSLVNPTKSNGLPLSTLFTASPSHLLPEDWLPPGGTNGSTGSSSSSSSSTAPGDVWTLRHHARVWGETFITPGVLTWWDLHRLPGGILAIAPNASLSFDNAAFVNTGVLGDGSSTTSNSPINDRPAWLQPLANYTLMMWAFGVDRGQQQLRPPAPRLYLTNSVIAIPPDELQLILSVILNISRPVSLRVDPQAVQLLRGFLNDSLSDAKVSSAKVLFSYLALPGISMTNVSLEPEELGSFRGYSLLPPQASILVDQSTPPAPSSSSPAPNDPHPTPAPGADPGHQPSLPSAGHDHWQGSAAPEAADNNPASAGAPQSLVIGLAVGCAVGVAALLGMAAGLLLWRRRRGRRSGAASKVLPGQAETAVSGHQAILGPPGTTIATNPTTDPYDTSTLQQGSNSDTAREATPAASTAARPTSATTNSSSLGPLGVLQLPDMPGGSSASGAGDGGQQGQGQDPGLRLGPVPRLVLSEAAAPKDNGGHGSQPNLRQMLSTLLLQGRTDELQEEDAAATANSPPATSPSPEIQSCSEEESATQVPPTESASAQDPGSMPGSRQAGSSGQSSKPKPMDEVKEIVGGLVSSMALDGNRLVIQKKIGQGGFGAVYKGRWRNLDVAVKTITFHHLDLPEGQQAAGPEQARLLQKAQDAKKRALTEAAVAHSIVHPNVVTTYHYDVAQSTCAAPGRRGLRGLEIVGGQAHQAATQYTLYLVQEFCTASLADVIGKGLLSMGGGAVDLEVVLHIVTSIACGMVYVHSRGIIHGDLKPDNVLMKHEVTKEGNGPPEVSMAIKVCDFGLCNLLDDGRSHVSGVTMGTPFYAAPEMVHRHQVTKASDVYAMGVIMWEVYTGMQPYTWKDGGGSELQRNPHFGVFPAHCPPAFQRLALACLHPHPGARPTFQDIFLLTTDLLDQLSGRSAK